MTYSVPIGFLTFFLDDFLFVLECRGAGLTFGVSKVLESDFAVPEMAKRDKVPQNTVKFRKVRLNVGGENGGKKIDSRRRFRFFMRIII